MLSRKSTHTEKGEAGLYLVFLVALRLEAPCLDQIIDAVDVEPMSDCIEYPDWILPFQQLL